MAHDCTNADTFTDADQTISVAESATIEDEEILSHYRESHSTDITSDKNDEESIEEPRLSKRPS